MAETERILGSTSSYVIPYYKILECKILCLSIRYPSVMKCQFLRPPPQSPITRDVSCLDIGVSVSSSEVLSRWTLRVSCELKSE